jgi:lysophospholipase L1-like esterase
MRIKTILIISIIALLVFLIYLTTLDKKVYYLSLGDSLAMGQTPYGNSDYGYTDYVRDYLIKKNVFEKHINQFSEKGYRISDLSRDIEDNKKIIIDDKPQTIKNALVKADLVTLSIGLNDLLYTIGINNTDKENMYEYIDEMMLDMDELFKLIKEYCKEDIMVLGYYVPTLYLSNEDVINYIRYTNNKLKTLCNNYNINFIEIDKIIENNTKYLPNPLDIHPSKMGYEVISTEIIEKIEQTLLKK